MHMIVLILRFFENFFFGNPNKKKIRFFASLNNVSRVRSRLYPRVRLRASPNLHN